jgi:hypothetical protein
MEKKIMKPAEIWITLLLPILVSPRRPTFSLCIGQSNIHNVRHNMHGTGKRSGCKLGGTNKQTQAYRETVEPLTVPNSPLNSSPIPWFFSHIYVRRERAKNTLIFSTKEIKHQQDIFQCFLAYGKELTCHPMPLLKTSGGGGVALASRAAA